MFISKYQILLLFVLPLLTALLSAKPIINLLKKLKSIQSFRELGPQSHITEKSGTPTMGSWIFVLQIIIFASYFYFSQNSFMSLTTSTGDENLSVGSVDKDFAIALISFLGAFLMGLVDDSLKIFQSNYKGLSSIQKLLIQFLIAALVLIFSSKAFTIFALAWAFIVIAGSCNAFNLTDGLDALATSQAIISLIGLQGLLCMQGDFSLLPLISIIVASLIGFLVFNIKPARVFMGDSGSLALGMVIGVMAYIKDLEWYLLLIATIPVLESLSVIIQVLFFKITKKIYGEGRRLFKMSPLHHHFELSGFSENQVVVSFVLFQALITAVTLYLVYSQILSV
ncbi:MAG: phospho-N-acetylmuramoyl-pentapeptide-transferase [Candidatus Caenarcaniphilales bacterium]|nr:phospho-N-acetylmuramoyl-pentapeptide-transferase [Candidatus Caenarcaniphilales bacterium]